MISSEVFGIFEELKKDLITCQICRGSTENILLCPKCGKPFCDSCLEKFSLQKKSFKCAFCEKLVRKQNFNRVSSYIKVVYDAVKKVESYEKCFVHNQPLEFYCSKCQKSVCIRCLFDKHKAPEHNCVELEKICDESINKVKSGIKVISENMKEISEVYLVECNEILEKLKWKKNIDLEMIKKCGLALEKRYNEYIEELENLKLIYLKAFHQYDEKKKNFENFLEVSHNHQVPLFIQILKDLEALSISLPPPANNYISLFPLEKEEKICFKHDFQKSLIQKEEKVLKYFEAKICFFSLQFEVLKNKSEKEDIFYVDYSCTDIHLKGEIQHDVKFKIIGCKGILFEDLELERILKHGKKFRERSFSYEEIDQFANHGNGDNTREIEFEFLFRFKITEKIREDLEEYIQESSIEEGDNCQNHSTLSKNSNEKEDEFLQKKRETREPYIKKETNFC